MSKLSRRVEYELLSAQHFHEWGAAICPDPVFGAACRVNGELVALGGVWAVDERVWAIFDRRPGCPIGVHRVALQILDVLDTQGVNEIWAELDETKPKAEEWLTRCGFARTTISGVWRRGTHHYAAARFQRHQRGCRIT